MDVSEEPSLDESSGIPPVEIGKGIEETIVPSSSEKNETNCSSLEETKVPILEDNTGEASDAAYIASSEKC